jgi:hypothetical protein
MDVIFEEDVLNYVYLHDDQLSFEIGGCCLMMRNPARRVSSE